MSAVTQPGPQEQGRTQSGVDIDIFQLSWDLGKVASSLDDAARLVDGGRHTKDQLEGINERMLRSVNWARRLIRHDLETSRVFDGHLAYRPRDDHLAGAVSAPPAPAQ